MSNTRIQGTVKWFDQGKGFGFLVRDDGGKDVFVHFSGIEGEGYRNLEQGQRVSFLTQPGRKGEQAAFVRVI